MDSGWTEESVGATPQRLKGQVPVFGVIRSFTLTLGLESLVVDRWFTDSGYEGLRVSYERERGYSESVNILNGKINNVITVPEEPKQNQNEAEFKYLVRVCFRPSQKPPTYHNIKRFEKELKQLPWQKDLQAVYRGDGTFQERR